MKILFISRAYPPVTGGIENQNYELSVHLPEITETKTIANRYGKKFLPIFFPIALFRALFLMRKYDILLLGDGVLAILGWLVKIIHRKPVVSIVHGLDLTYKMSLYQKLWVGFFIPKMDKLIAVGNETIRRGIQLNIPKEKFAFIPNGVDTEKFIADYSRADLEKITKMDLKNKKIVLTLGRLAKRKGVAWFIENVIPKLDKNILYFIAGGGEDENNIRQAILKNNLKDRVKMFGKVSDEERKILYNTTDIFVQPNIEVKGDMEGFGLVVLEAASCRRVVVVSRLEGLQDAIKDGKNGFLIETRNTKQYAEKINALMREDDFREVFGQRAREYTKENYTWKKIAGKYMEILKNL